MPTRREFLEVSTSAVASGTLGAACGFNASSPVTEQTSHRPWPLPQKRWVLFMRWHDLLFLHYPVRPEVIRSLIPSVLELDIFEGWCWIGIVPFHMSGVRPRYGPLAMSFPELNVRTYVKTSHRPGVWFFSLDAASWLAVRTARWLGMPYYDASMKVESQQDSIHYTSVRNHKGAAPAEFRASYGPTGSVYHASTGTLDHWLTERYCLYTELKPGRVVYAEIHHPQWQLQAATLELRSNTMAQASGIALPNGHSLCHFSRYQEVVAWPIVSLEHAGL
jgi:uncharacterized protein